MTFKIRFSRRALADMEHALEESRETFGDVQFEVYKELIRLALADIAADPLRPGVRWRRELHRDARIYHLSRKGQPASHYFVYKVEGKDVIFLSRMLHDAMDLGRHLPPALAADK